MNINSRVSVVLTKTGVDILRNRDMEFGLRLPITASMRNEIIARTFTYREGMVHTCMMWDLLCTFGPYITMASETPFYEITEV